MVAGSVALPVEPMFLTVDEVAKTLHICRSHVYSLMDRGDLEYCKFGTARRVPRESLAKYVENAKVVGR